MATVSETLSASSPLNLSGLCRKLSVQKPNCVYCYISGSNFIQSLMDKHNREDMTVDEALELIDMSIGQIRMRLIVAPPNFTVKIVDKDGARLFAHRNSAEVIQ